MSGQAAEALHETASQTAAGVRCPSPRVALVAELRDRPCEASSALLWGQWHLVSDFGPVDLWGSGRFVLAEFENGTGHYELIDDQTGRSARLKVPRGCRLNPFAMGGGLLLFACRYTGQSLPPMKLYSFSSPRGWRTLAWSPQLVQQCASPDLADGQYTQCAPAAIGSHWIEVAVTVCVDFGHDCSSGGNVFQNLDTGRLANDPTSVGGTVIPDLNSPTAARELCAPLRVPSAGQGRAVPGPLPGTVALYGRFAVSSVAYVDDPGSGSAYLQECGSSLNQQLSYNAEPSPGYAPPVGNTRVIVWAPDVGIGQVGRQLNAVVLPTLKRLVIAVPEAIGASSTLVIGPRHLYMIGSETRDLYTVPTQALSRSSARR